MGCFSKPVYTTAFVYNITNGAENYIGSTEKTLEERLKKHENCFKCYLEGKYHYVSSFEIIKKGNYRIELLEECNVNTTHELRIIEGTYQQEMGCVNQRIAGLTHKESDKKYYETHKVELIERKKKYQKENGAKLKEKFNCECGGKYTFDNKSHHIKTQRHIQSLSASSSS
jgi:hypothetical protein